MKTPDTKFPREQLHAFTTGVFERCGLTDEDARLAADVILAADMRGIGSHGIGRLWAYVLLLESGKANPRPELKIVRESASTAAIECDRGLGLIVAPRANEIAMQKAAEAGMAWVTVSGSSHYGIAGYYVLQALERGLIGWSMTNASPRVTPLWGAQSNLSTNPIAIAFPAGKEKPIVIDMSTAVAASGRVEVAHREGKSIPDGWLVDAEGRPSTRPDDLFEGGSLLPLGGDREHGGHKGTCLASMVDLLCGVLSGANWGPFVPSFIAPDDSQVSVGKGIGHCLAAMRIDAFMDSEEFKARVDQWIHTMRSTKPAPGTSGPIIPGDPERQAEDERRVAGIPLSENVVESLREIARKTGLEF